MKIIVESELLRIKKLTQKDIPDILELYMGNTEYFKHCLPNPTFESVKEDLEGTPEGVEKDNKLFLGIYDGKILIAVVDLIKNFPNTESIWIGLYILKLNYQGKGFATSLYCEIEKLIKKEGYKYIQLAYVKTNRRAMNFWQKNHFVKTGREVEQEKYTVVVLEKRLIE